MEPNAPWAVVFTGLTALFTGIAALRPVVVRKPIGHWTETQKGARLALIINPNPEHFVSIFDIINRSGNQVISVTHFDSKGAEVGPPQAISNILRTGILITPKGTKLFAFYGLEGVPDYNLPIFTIRRAGFNFFSAKPRFNIVFTQKT